MKSLFMFTQGLLLTALMTPACSDDARPGAAAAPAGSILFPTSSVVFADQGQSTYVALLRSLGVQQIDRSQSREFAGWADLWVHAGKLFVADGESPTLTRYAVDAAGAMVEEGRLGFQNHGAKNAAFWAHLFLDKQRAYWFNTEARQVVTWDPEALVITGSFAMPALADRDAQRLAGPTADRSSLVRGGRAYVPFYWADWKNYGLSEDSVILVIDTASNQVVDTLAVPCPEINFAALDSDGTMYFSNWGYSAAPTLLDGKARACAVRILPASDRIDPAWSLTFADVTGGREASSLRLLGGGKALLTVFHHERATLAKDTDRYALVDSANWRLWTLDLATRQAAPLEALGWHTFGLYGTRVDGELLLSVPGAEFKSTTTYRLAVDGSAERRWESTGWQTRLFKLTR